MHWRIRVAFHLQATFRRRWQMGSCKEGPTEVYDPTTILNLSFKTQEPSVRWHRRNNIPLCHPPYYSSSCAGQGPYPIAALSRADLATSADREAAFCSRGLSCL